MQTIEEYLRIERLKKGLSQENMAFELNISQAAYSKIESGKTELTLKMLGHIVEILDLDIRQVITESKWSMGTDLGILQKWWVRLKLYYYRRGWKGSHQLQNPEG